MTKWQKLALSGAFFGLAYLYAPNEAVAACAHDTYCAHYTDNTYTHLCGESNQCVNCSTHNEGWGCWSQNRWCQTYGSCGAAASCTRCYDWGCIQGGGCPPGP
jgi:hypothetical protein